MIKICRGIMGSEKKSSAARLILPLLTLSVWLSACSKTNGTTVDSDSGDVGTDTETGEGDSGDSETEWASDSESDTVDTGSGGGEGATDMDSASDSLSTEFRDTNTGDTGDTDISTETEDSDTNTDSNPHGDTDTESDTNSDTDTDTDTESEPEDDAGASAPDGDGCILINGNAETGDIEGWTASGPEVGAVPEQAETKGVVSPMIGSRFFTFAKSQSEFSSLTQSSDACLVPGSLFALTGFVQTEAFVDHDGDFGMVEVNLKNGLGDIVATAAEKTLITDNGVWMSFRVDVEVPEGTSSWEVVLSGTLIHGTFVNVFFDDIAVEAECHCLDGDTDSSVMVI